jgi:8-oxo-dGTP pyrophosphatase MutT (NUDIX family)
MDIDRTLFGTPWVAIKESPWGYHYLERKGKDSIAVFLLRKISPSTSLRVSPERSRRADRKEYEVLIRQQPLAIRSVSLDEELPLYPCPITGGIDGEESPEEAAVREVYEESGFSVEVLPLGKYFVGTQTNEICYMYYADVTGVEPEVAQQDGSYFEAVSKNEWHPFEYLKKCDYGACQLGYFKLKEIIF